MRFCELQKGDKFFFLAAHKNTGGSVYRKVGKSTYVYNSDSKNLWKFWTPDYTVVCKAEG